MDTWVQIALAIIGTFGASTGFWAYIQHRSQTKSASARLLMGIAYNELVTRGAKYIERGWVSTDEFDDYEKYYFRPYKDLGGNGTAERIMNEVRSLPFSSKSPYDDLLKKREFINNVRVIPAAESGTVEAPAD